MLGVIWAGIVCVSGQTCILFLFQIYLKCAVNSQGSEPNIHKNAETGVTGELLL